jgi:CubicO group peptidase (beta-lactamase class C family)
MKCLKKSLKRLVIGLFGLTVFLYVFDLDYLIKAVRTIYARGYTTAYLEDYKVFDNRVIEAGEAQPWAIHKDYNTVTATAPLQVFHDRSESVAFLIIKNDSIWHESYFQGYDQNSKSNSFSMAKSIVSALLGKAIMEGYISGLDQKVSDFFPQFREGLGARLTVGDLSSMSSGLNWDEAYYSPLSITTRSYFDDDLEKVILGLKVVEEPEQSFKYLSGSTELLAMVITKATGKKLSSYLSDSFWKPLGAENEAFWQLDSEAKGLEKAYCCIGSNARDFARFGKLYKQNGKWQGQQLLDSAFVAKSIRPRFPSSPEYGYGWWLANHLGKEIFYMRGHLGQLVIVIPEDDLIVVRLGRTITKNDVAVDAHSPDFYTIIDEVYKMTP